MNKYYSAIRRFFIEMPRKNLDKVRQCFKSPTLLSAASKRLNKGKISFTRTRKIGVVGLCSIMFGIVFQTLIFQNLLEQQMKKVFFPILFCVCITRKFIAQKVALKQGWPMRETWSKLPFPWELHVYLFNVTNPAEIAKGEKPIVQEVGPFVYDVWQEKTNQIDYEEDDTLSYSTKNTYYFNADKSRGLSDEEELIFPHFISLGIANGAMKVIPLLLPIAEKIVDSVMDHPQSVFVKMKVKIFLFDGYEISCVEPRDFFEAAFCNQIRMFWSRYRMRKKDDNVYLVSIYGALNGTDTYSGKTRLRRGTRKINEVGDLVEFNDKTNMSIWDNDECDTFVGTDGTIFHPFLNNANKQNLYVTNTFYCRALTYRYDSDVEFSGLTLQRYTTSLGYDDEVNSKEKCYCRDPDNCLRSGAYELWKCLNTVRIASNPHFYKADPYYINAVEGLNPIKEKHMTILDIDPLTGLAVRSHFRIQFNLLLTKLKKYRLMEDFPEALLPIMWADEVMILPDFITKKIASTHQSVTTAKVSTYSFVFIGLGMCGYAIFFDYRSRRKRHSLVKTIALELEKHKIQSTHTNGT